MSSSSARHRLVGRSDPFRGFSRGIPIVGHPPEPEQPAGLHYYHLPVLIQTEAGLRADVYQVKVPSPLDGISFSRVGRQLEDEIQALEPPPRRSLLDRLLRRPAPRPARVILLSPVPLGFIPDAAAQGAEGAAETPETPGDRKSVV